MRVLHLAGLLSLLLVFTSAGPDPQTTTLAYFPACTAIENSEATPTRCLVDSIPLQHVTNTPFASHQPRSRHSHLTDAVDGASRRFRRLLQFVKRRVVADHTHDDDNSDSPSGANAPTSSGNEGSGDESAPKPASPPAAAPPANPAPQKEADTPTNSPDPEAPKNAESPTETATTTKSPQVPPLPNDSSTTTTTEDRLAKAGNHIANAAGAAGSGGLPAAETQSTSPGATAAASSGSSSTFTPQAGAAASSNPAAATSMISANSASPIAARLKAHTPPAIAHPVSPWYNNATATITPVSGAAASSGTGVSATSSGTAPLMASPVPSVNGTNLIGRGNAGVVGFMRLHGHGPYWNGTNGTSSNATSVGTASLVSSTAFSTSGAATSSPYAVPAVKIRAPAASSECFPTVPYPFNATVVNATTGTNVVVSGFPTGQIFLKVGFLSTSDGGVAYFDANHQLRWGTQNMVSSLVCGNGSIVLGGSAVLYRCLSVSSFQLFNKNVSSECSPAYISVVSTGTSFFPSRRNVDDTGAILPRKMLQSSTAVPTTTPPPTVSTQLEKRSYDLVDHDEQVVKQKSFSKRLKNGNEGDGEKTETKTKTKGNKRDISTTLAFEVDRPSQANTILPRQYSVTNPTEPANWAYSNANSFYAPPSSGQLHLSAVTTSQSPSIGELRSTMSDRAMATGTAYGELGQNAAGMMSMDMSKIGKGAASMKLTEPEARDGPTLTPSPCLVSEISDGQPQAPLSCSATTPISTTPCPDDVQTITPPSSTTSCPDTPQTDEVVVNTIASGVSTNLKPRQAAGCPVSPSSSVTPPPPASSSAVSVGSEVVRLAQDVLGAWFSLRASEARTIPSTLTTLASPSSPTPSPAAPSTLSTLTTLASPPSTIPAPAAPSTPPPSPTAAPTSPPPPPPQPSSTSSACHNQAPSFDDCSDSGSADCAHDYDPCKDDQK